MIPRPFPSISIWIFIVLTCLLIGKLCFMSDQILRLFQSLLFLKVYLHGCCSFSPSIRGFRGTNINHWAQSFYTPLGIEKISIRHKNECLFLKNFIICRITIGTNSILRNSSIQFYAFFSMVSSIII